MAAVWRPIDGIEAKESSMNDPKSAAQAASGRSNHALALVLSWAVVGLPLAWGVSETLRKALALFQ